MIASCSFPVPYTSRFALGCCWRFTCDKCQKRGRLGYGLYKVIFSAYLRGKRSLSLADRESSIILTCCSFLWRMSRQQLAVQRARKSFQTGKTKPLESRIHQLRNLLRFVTERRKDIAEAVKKDLSKVTVSLLTAHGTLASSVNLWMNTISYSYY